MMSGKRHERLVVFTRYPEAGKTKTRLIPALGEQGAAELQRRMTEHLVEKLDNLLPSRSLSLEIRFEGGDEALMRAWLGSNYSYHPQPPGDIGQGMRTVFDETFGSGAENAVIIGTDIPGISADLISNAFDQLYGHDLVVGPARDGGYYLIGIQKDVWPKVNPVLFQNIAWGTTTVLSQTLAASDKMDLNYALLETLDDVDRPEDLDVWYRESRKSASGKSLETISIIIPALNEAGSIETTLSMLPDHKAIEVIVVDGGSRDGTLDLAKSHGATVLQTDPSKSRQMNAGAEAAGGKILLFLHADTRLPKNFENSIRYAVDRDGFCAGAFRLRIESESKGLRFIERVANWRSRFLQTPYGDQGIFMTKSLFQEIGGYADMVIMEDFELIRRLKRKGKIIILDQAVITSPRRWQNLGILNTWLLNQVIAIGYMLGCPPERLARWYRREKGKSAQ
jgi:rSAM/selenodomain-associated transferase 2/rSAM/selenodomain-associated transferase 1